MPPGIFVALFGYLLGSVPTGLLLARLFSKVDPRKVGSKNIGATNIFRTAGKGLGVFTLIEMRRKAPFPSGWPSAWGFPDLGRDRRPQSLFRSHLPGLSRIQGGQRRRHCARDLPGSVSDRGPDRGVSLRRNGVEMEIHLPWIDHQCPDDAHPDRLFQGRFTGLFRPEPHHRGLDPLASSSQYREAPVRQREQVERKIRLRDQESERGEKKPQAGPGLFTFSSRRSGASSLFWTAFSKAPSGSAVSRRHRPLQGSFEGSSPWSSPAFPTVR